MINKDSSLAEIADYLHNQLAHILLFVPALVVKAALNLFGK